MKALTKLALAAMLLTTALAFPVETAVTADQTQTAYVASASREPFHKPTCAWAKKIAAKNLESFKTRDQAIKAGHRPCKVCKS